MVAILSTTRIPSNRSQLVTYAIVPVLCNMCSFPLAMRTNARIIRQDIWTNVHQYNASCCVHNTVNITMTRTVRIFKLFTIGANLTPQGSLNHTLCNSVSHVCYLCGSICIRHEVASLLMRHLQSSFNINENRSAHPREGFCNQKVFHQCLHIRMRLHERLNAKLALEDI